MSSTAQPRTATVRPRREPPRLAVDRLEVGRLQRSDAGRQDHGPAGLGQRDAHCGRLLARPLGHDGPVAAQAAQEAGDLAAAQRGAEQLLAQERDDEVRAGGRTCEATGLSSSPSKAPPPYDRARFPDIRVADNVRSQHQLLTEHFREGSLPPGPGALGVG